MQRRFRLIKQDAITTLIADNAVTNPKLEDMDQSTIKGRAAGAGTGDPANLTATEVRLVLSISNVENTALSTWAGTTNITTLGTVVTGTWNGTVIANAYVATALTGKTYNALTLTAQASGFTIAGGTVSRTLTVAADANVSGTNTGDQAGANPTASAGLTAVNGVATTFMRSDGAPAISQSINPTWSGTHIFSNGVTAASFSGIGTSLTALNASNIASGSLADARLSANVPLLNAANTFTAGNTITPSGASTALTLNAAATTRALAVAGAANQYTSAMVASPTSGQSYGLLVSGGTTAADQSLRVTSQSGVTDYLIVRGDGQSEFLDGSASIPSMSFLTDTNTGIYRAGIDSLSISTGGVERVNVASTGKANFNYQVLGTGGNSGTPSFSFGGDPDTGMFNGGVDILDLSTGGTSRVSVSAATTNVTSTALRHNGNTVTHVASTPTWSAAHIWSASARFNSTIGFQGTAPIAKPAVTGARGGNAALASLLTALANYGLITDSTTA